MTESETMVPSSVLQTDLGSPSRTGRAVPRYSFVAVSKTEATNEICVIGRVSDISRKGCYVDMPNSPSLGTLLNMVLSRDGGSFATRGKVIYADRSGMGVAFADPTDEQLSVLDSWLAEPTNSTR
jgi:hypothetical protein